MHVVVAVVVAGPEPPGLTAPLQVQAAVPAERALDTVRAARPAVVLVDLDAHPAATATLGQLIAELPDVPVVALADGPDDVLDVVRAGAAGYVLRADPALPDILRTAAAGGTAFGEGLAEHILDATPAVPDEAPRLTDREADVLRLVVEGFTAKQIGSRLGLSPRTVENHIQRTLRKCAVPGRAALVRYAIEHGLA